MNNEIGFPSDRSRVPARFFRVSPISSRRRFARSGSYAGRAAASRIAHELQEASGDLRAAVGLLLDELEIGRKVLEGVETGELGDLRALPQRLRAARDGRQRIVQFVSHTGGEPPRRAQPLGQEQGHVDYHVGGS